MPLTCAQGKAEIFRISTFNPPPRTVQQSPLDCDTAVYNSHVESLGLSDIMEKRASDSDASHNDGSNGLKRKREPDSLSGPGGSLDSLRLRSRQDYLQKRTEQQIDLLRAQVRDEAEEERSAARLSRREQQAFARNREILQLTDELARIDDRRDNYYIPEDYIADAKKRDAVLHAKQREGENFVSDHQLWENEQTVRAARQPAMAESGAAAADDEWEYVFDESRKIQFVAEAAVRGKPLTAEQRQLRDRIDQAQQKVDSIEKQRKNLPMYKFRDDLLDAIKEYQVMIVVAETGSGKTTQIPQYLHEAGFTNGGMKVGCTQPRRVAAMSVATRVAEEMGVRVGHEVGYSIRFEDNTSPKTVIKYMTDGMLLRELLTEPDLSSYTALMVDEAHERTLHTDILFGLVKDITKARPDLKLIISSATMDAQKFSAFFDDAPIFNVPGRVHPVQVHYTSQPEANYLQAAYITILQIHQSQGLGDVLVFLTGQEEIEAMEQMLQDFSRKMGKVVSELVICPIYANLPSELQAKIFEPTPPKARKIVLATNIAETSLTIDGIVYVIDPGFVKENVYNPRTGMESLVTTPISRASANQRKGRAGRVGPGMCFRLYTAWAYANELDESNTPEIQRTNLNSVVLTLSSLGITNLVDFDFMDPPAVETLEGSYSSLYALGAFNDKGELTKIGRQMAEFPTDPMLAKAILAADKHGCVEEVLSIVSMLGEASSLFFRPSDKKLYADSARARFTNKDAGDHLTLLNVWNEWVDSEYGMVWARENFLQYRSLKRARDVREQLQALCERVEITLSSAGANDFLPIQKAVLAGFFPHVARLRRDGQGYSNVKSNVETYIHPSSTLMGWNPPPRFVVYHELVLTSKEYMRSCMPVKPEWLHEIAPHYHKKKEDLLEQQKRVPARSQL